MVTARTNSEGLMYTLQDRNGAAVVAPASTEARGQAARVASLRPFFRPRSVAVIGASRDPAGVGHRLLRALLAGPFPGVVYPVNPRAAEVAGLRAYPSA